jgi:diguanylate cyclase (GGDEF)-like protein
VVARLGGDEFAVYLKGIADEPIAGRIAQSMLAAVGAIREVDGMPIVVGCSIGITLFEAPVPEGIDADQVLARADEAMFEAKRDGKGRFQLRRVSFQVD